MTGSNAPEQGSLQAVSFEVSGLFAALPVGEALEVVPTAPLTRVPNAHPVLMGLCNVRGGIVPVIDLSLLLEGAPTMPGPSSRLLLAGNPVLGFWIDQVHGLKNFVGEGLRPAIAATERLLPYCSVVHEQGGQHWQVLSLSSLLANPALSGQALPEAAV